MPKTAKIDFERTGIRITLGHTERQLQKWEESEASEQAAIALLDELFAAHPTDNGYALRLANTLLNLSVVLNHDGRLDTAQQAYPQVPGVDVTRHAILADLELLDAHLLQRAHRVTLVK